MRKKRWEAAGKYSKIGRATEIQPIKNRQLVGVAGTAGEDTALPRAGGRGTVSEFEAEGHDG